MLKRLVFFFQVSIHCNRLNSTNLIRLRSKLQIWQKKNLLTLLSSRNVNSVHLLSGKPMAAVESFKEDGVVVNVEDAEKRLKSG